MRDRAQNDLEFRDYKGALGMDLELQPFKKPRHLAGLFH